MYCKENTIEPWRWSLMALINKGNMESPCHLPSIRHSTPTATCDTLQHKKTCPSATRTHHRLDFGDLFHWATPNSCSHWCNILLDQLLTETLSLANEMGWARSQTVMHKVKALQSKVPPSFVRMMLQCNSFCPANVCRHILASLHYWLLDAKG